MRFFLVFLVSGLTLQAGNPHVLTNNLADSFEKMATISVAGKAPLFRKAGELLRTLPKSYLETLCGNKLMLELLLPLIEGISSRSFLRTIERSQVFYQMLSETTGESCEILGSDRFPWSRHIMESLQPLPFPEATKKLIEIKLVQPSLPARAMKERVTLSFSDELLAASLIPAGRSAFRDQGPDHFEFVTVEPGTFYMGKSRNENCFPLSPPQRKVTLTKPFDLQTTEVTQRLWEQVMGSNPVRVVYRGTSKPVEDVSWDDISGEETGFLDRLNHLLAEEGCSYRLPSEAEWEYAARGGRNSSEEMKQAVYFFGDDPEKLSEFAILGNRSPAPVGSKKPNPLGVYDMLGNVWEYVSDYTLRDEDYVKLPLVDPVNRTPDDLNRRVIKGGDAGNSACDVRPSYNGAAYRGACGLGLRLVRSCR